MEIGVTIRGCIWKSYVELLLYILSAVIVLILLLYNFRIACISHLKHPSYAEYEFPQEMDDCKENMPHAMKVVTKKRIISIDAFRGMSLLIMIFVNYGGGGYWWLQHSTWNGLTIADLVFPWFIFIMGTTMAVVFTRKLAKAEENNIFSENALQNPMINNNNLPAVSVNTIPTLITKKSLIKAVLIRSLKLFAIGMFLNNGNSLKYWRIPGVLQYFSVAYAINGLVIIAFNPNVQTIIDYQLRDKRWLIFNISEIILYWPQWLILLSILIANVFIVYLLPVSMFGEECPKGYFGPGGIGDYGEHMQCTGGAHRFVDYAVFGSNHVYQYPTSKDYYHTGWYDPEGILGMMTATFLCFLGIYIGRILNIYQTHKQRITRWMFSCILFGVIAGCLCKFSKNDGYIPINKNLWSLSFILCQASTGIAVFVVFYVFIDLLKCWDGKPFHWLGRNSIVLYIGHEILGGYFPLSFSYGDENHYQLLLSNCIGVCCWIAVAYYMYTHNVFYNL